jgi:hypothetical protein
MRVIQEDAMKPGRLPADFAKVIEKCCQDIGRRVALREMSIEIEKEKEPERLIQLEGLRAQVSMYAVAKDKGNMVDLMRVKQALPPLLQKYLEDLEADGKEGLQQYPQRRRKPPARIDLLPCLIQCQCSGGRPVESLLRP